MYTTYALKSLTKKYIYVGITNNLARRVAEHNNGHNKTTRPYRPFQVLYTEEQETRVTARECEKYLKSGAGKEFLKSLA